MRLLRRTPGRVPPEIAAQLAADEAVLGLGTDDTGRQLAVTRRRLLVLAATGGAVVPVPWFQIARVRLDSGVLEVVTLERVGDFAGDGDLVTDAPPVRFVVGRANRLTDQVHQRVRASVAAAEHVAGTGSGGWVTLRRVAGADGLLAQLRLDPGADPHDPGLLAAAEQVLARLRGAPAAGTTGADD